ncbi:hypothetical protein BDY19DRAFT_1036622 [Irpex rosettiformis]|uniref:Uncharacterized protein n=1 Tax=Irpex rosettiformis TaxID=378272 RepID=A0ACB8U7Q7_9APHY|nr:hypothetical protein BDY19DRAFT_1036622 [Irpex rosettiformis]
MPVPEYLRAFRVPMFVDVLAAVLSSGNSTTTQKESITNETRRSRNTSRGLRMIRQLLPITIQTYYNEPFPLTVTGLPSSKSLSKIRLRESVCHSATGTAASTRKVIDMAGKELSYEGRDNPTSIQEHLARCPFAVDERNVSSMGANLVTVPIASLAEPRSARDDELYQTQFVKPAESGTVFGTTAGSHYLQRLLNHFIQGSRRGYSRFRIVEAKLALGSFPFRVKDP